jgi:predicted ATPase
LDNFEQLLTAGLLVASLLAAAPLLKILITSRTILHLYGEHTFPIQPLSLPKLEQLPTLALPTLAAYPAVHLFVERAQAHKPDFTLTTENMAAVVESCVRLGGLPLAIELAAARIRLLNPQALLARLSEVTSDSLLNSAALQLLTSGPRDLPPRQQTLRNTLEWSYNLLQPSQQKLLTTLAVFRGGFTIEACEAICQIETEATKHSFNILDDLGALVDSSLVQASHQQPNRFEMLELVREYALEQLIVNQNLEQIQQNHAFYYLMLAETLELSLQGSNQTETYTTLEIEHSNLRIALDWLLRTEQLLAALRLISALEWFWWLHVHWQEGLTYATTALSLAASHNLSLPPILHARVLGLIGGLAKTQWNHQMSFQFYTQSLALWREVGDKAGIAEALLGLGNLAQRQNKIDEARPLYMESLNLWRELGDKRNLSRVLGTLGSLELQQGAYDQAKNLLSDALELHQEMGDTQSIASAKKILADIAVQEGNFSKAVELYEQCLALFRPLSAKVSLAYSLKALAVIYLIMANFALASKYLEESLILFDTLENQTEFNIIKFLLEASQTLQAASQASLPLPISMHELQQQIAQQNLVNAFASLKKLEETHFETS